MAEDPEVLASRLNSVLNELKGVMQDRKDRVEELRNQIIILENNNEDMEKRINELILDAF
jgi:chaperonin cofactor prefoldin